MSVYMYAYAFINTRVWVYKSTRVGAFCLFVLSNLSTTFACITGVSCNTLSGPGRAYLQTGLSRTTYRSHKIVN